MEHWPALFDDKKLRPLQMGIRDALIQDALERKLDVDTRQIVRGLQAWAQRPAYIRCVAAGGQRYGIDGRAVGEVSGADIEGAIDRIIALGSASRWTKG